MMVKSKNKINYDKKAQRIIEFGAGNFKTVSRLEIGAYDASGFEKMQDFTLQVFRMLFLANSGALVAIMALLGSFVSSGREFYLGQSIYGVTSSFVLGVVSSVCSVCFAMLSQKYYNKPIRVEKTDSNIKSVSENLRKGNWHRSWSIKFSVGSLFFFVVGCMWGIYVFSNQLKGSLVSLFC